MQMLIPIETPGAIIEMMGEAENIKVGKTFSIDEEIRISLQELVVNDEGQYFIPLFTSEKEFSKGGYQSRISQPFEELIVAIESWSDCLGCIINHSDNELVLSKDIINMVKKHTLRSHISIVKGSVLDMHVGAIVQSGETKIADAKEYNIEYADYIIETPCPVFSDKPIDGEILFDCYKNSLDLALKAGCMSVAFPGNLIEIPDYLSDEAAEVALMMVVDWFKTHTDVTMNVYFCCSDDIEFSSYMKMIQ